MCFYRFLLPASGYFVYGYQNKWEESLCLLFRFPLKSIWVSSSGYFSGSSFDFSVLGSFVFKLLPAFRHAEQVFAFFSKSARKFGHQKITASLNILFIPRWLNYNALSGAYRRLLGMMIRSSTIVIPQRWVSFLATCL